MITTEKIRHFSEFEALKDGDCVACQFKTDVTLGKKRIRFGVFTIVRNKHESTEIILDSKSNVYFNYNMFCNPEQHGVSNLADIILIRAEDGK